MKIEKHRKEFKVLIKIKNMHAVTYNHGDTYIFIHSKGFIQRLKEFYVGL